MSTMLLILIVLAILAILAIAMLFAPRVAGVFIFVWKFFVFLAADAMIRILSHRPRLASLVVVLAAAARGAIGAWFVYVVSFLLTDFEQFRSHSLDYVMIGGLIVMYPVAFVLRACEVSQNTSRPANLRASESVVLFLRSFRTEGAFRDESGFFVGTRVLSEEENVAEIFRAPDLGKFVALARPGERAQELGADRIDIGMRDWQEVVLRLLDRANAIVMRLGNSESLLWELDVVVRSGKLQQTLFMVPAAASADGMKQEYDDLIQKILNRPDYPRFPTTLNSRARFLYFDREGTPQVLMDPEKGTADVGDLLAPFFTQLGVSVPAKQLRPDNLIAKIMIACLAVYYLAIQLMPRIMRVIG